MTIVRERVILRRCRRTEGERLPHSIKLDKLSEGDSLIVEIVFNKKSDIRKCYRFRPPLLSDRKSVAFTVSGNEVYWLRGLAPEVIAPDKLPEDPKPATEARRKGRKPHAADQGVLIFDSGNCLDSIHRNLTSASKATNILLGSLEKLCKKKRPSAETGLSFRYLREKFRSDERVTSFRLTLEQYDEMCKRKKVNP